MLFVFQQNTNGQGLGKSRETEYIHQWILFVHVQHAVKHNPIKSVAILSNDIGIVAIAVGVFADLQTDGLEELCVA